MYNDYEVVDVHGHMMSPPQFRAYAYGIVSNRNFGENRLHIKDEAIGDIVKHHLSLLDERNIDVQFISPRPVAMMHWERPPQVELWTKTTNEVIAQQCSLSGERLFGIGQLPQTIVHDTSSCIDELRRCIEELGFVGVLMNTDPGADGQTPGVDQPYWYPLYEAAESLGCALLLHPSHSRNPKLDKIPHSFQYNFLVEETLATLLYEYSDVFDRYPDLKIVVCHCGGSPNRLLRISDKPGGAKDSGLSPGGSVNMPVEREVEEVPDRSANLFFDTCAYDIDYLRTVFRQRGADQMLFGTEAPGAGTGFINPATNRPADDLVPLIEALGILSDQEKKAVFSDNVRRVYPIWRALAEKRDQR
jgi:predicted TIM-barrel fold metal-dependent hydrolase